MCSCVGYVYVSTESMQVRRGCWIPWIWSHSQFWNACCGCWKLNLDSLEEQQVLSTIMAFLQPRAAVFLDCPVIPGHSSPWDGWRGESRTPRLWIQLLSLLPLGTTWKFIPEWVLEGASTGKVCVTGWTLPSVEGKTACLCLLSVSHSFRRDEVITWQGAIY